MIGLSLSLCVKDIIDGKISINEVDKIVVNVDINDRQKWSDLIIMYCNYCWEGFDERAMEICDTLKNSGRIEHVKDNHHVLLYKHHWINFEDEIEYCP